jgi:hypothetical protein
VLPSGPIRRTVFRPAIWRFAPSSRLRVATKRQWCMRAIQTPKSTRRQALPKPGKNLSPNLSASVAPVGHSPVYEASCVVVAPHYVAQRPVLMEMIAAVRTLHVLSLRCARWCGPCHCSRSRVRTGELSVVGVLLAVAIFPMLCPAASERLKNKRLFVVQCAQPI